MFIYSYAKISHSFYWCSPKIQHSVMDSANQIESLVHEVEKNPEYKISEQEAKGFLSEIKLLTKEDKTNMPPLVVIIMAYINMLFPKLEKVNITKK